MQLKYVTNKTIRRNFLILTNLVVVLVVVPLLTAASPLTPKKSVERLGRTMLAVLGISLKQSKLSNIPTLHDYGTLVWAD